MKGKSKFYLSCNSAKLQTFSSIEKKNHEHFDVTMTLQPGHVQMDILFKKEKYLKFHIKSVHRILICPFTHLFKKCVLGPGPRDTE